MNDQPVADAGPDQNGIIGGVLTFDGSGSSDEEGPLTSYFWDFGDGNNAIGAIVTHKYSIAGNFTVTLAITDSGGLTVQDSASILIAVSDMVDIIKAIYQNGKKQLIFEARSSKGGEAILTVIGYSVMTYDSKKDLYKLILENIGANPVTVTVSSSLGGVDTAKVNGKVDKK